MLILRTLLAGRPEIDQALIFGSWAERAVGRTGHEPNDVDVLAIGSIRPRPAAVLAREASELLGKEVNVMTTSVDS